MNNLIFLDFETFYDTKAGYSLRHMSTEEYITDPRFECNGLAWREGSTPTVFYPPDHVPRVVDSVDWSKTIAVAHHGRFDFTVLKHHYGVLPALMMDTLGMAQALIRPHTTGVSLAKMGKHFGLKEKGTYIHNVDGLHFHDIPNLFAFATYAMDDVNIMADAFYRMIKGFPKSELKIIDMLLRMYITPQLELDPHILAEHYGKVCADKAQLLATMGLEDASILRSNDKFASLLVSLGVDDPPTKVSPTTGKTTWAFAKTDWGFRELENHADEKVQTAVAARLGHKSTLEESRSERLLHIANKFVKLRVPLRYYAAHTGRLGGDEKINLQNLKRKSRIRDAIKAPDGYMLVVVDASQIEARLNGWMGGEYELCEQFRRGEDVYASFASKVYGYEITKATHPAERFVGKTGILSLGFGSGAKTFVHMLKVNDEMPMDMDLGQGHSVVNTYRGTYTGIRGNWYRANDVIALMATGGRMEIGPCVSEKEAILLPNGMKLQYPNLRIEDGEWYYNYGNERRRIYGPKLIENIIQALARIVVFEAALRIRAQKPQYFAGLTVHDEWLYVVPEDQAEEALALTIHEMSQPLDWCLECPFAAEGSIAKSYGAAK